MPWWDGLFAGLPPAPAPRDAAREPGTTTGRKQSSRKHDRDRATHKHTCLRIAQPRTWQRGGVRKQASGGRGGTQGGEKPCGKGRGHLRHRTKTACWDGWVGAWTKHPAKPIQVTSCSTACGCKPRQSVGASNGNWTRSKGLGLLAGSPAPGWPGDGGEGTRGGDPGQNAGHGSLRRGGPRRCRTSPQYRPGPQFKKTFPHKTRFRHRQSFGGLNPLQRLARGAGGIGAG